MKKEKCFLKKKNLISGLYFVIPCLIFSWGLTK